MLLQLLILETLILFASVIVGANSEKAEPIAHMIFGLTFFAILFTLAFGIAWARRSCSC